MHPHLRQNFTSNRLFEGYNALLANPYRFGFNGQERIDEIAGTGNHNTALYWEYDTRLGRRWNVDPRPYHSISGYGVLEFNPILNIDYNGDTTWVYSTKGDLLNVVYDQRQNETHFIDKDRWLSIRNGFVTSSKKDGTINNNEINAYADDIRAASVAYFGSSTKRRLLEILKGNKNEVTFGLKYRKPVSKELDVIVCNTCGGDESTIVPDNIVKENPEVSFFAVGHSHPAMAPWASRPTSVSRWYDTEKIAYYRDYRTVLDPTLSSHPLFLLSYKGITIYRSLTNENEEESNPSTLLWNSYKYYDYKQILKADEPGQPRFKNY